MQKLCQYRELCKDDGHLNRALRNTLAMVLAGGRGVRLKGLTDNQAKPALHFGGKFRIVDFPLSNCINSGIRRICLLTQYKAHDLILHVQRGWNFLQSEMGEFVELWPAQQQTGDQQWYQGTADAVFQNIRTIEYHEPKYILILAGDHIYKQDYSQMLAEHISRDADVTIACIEVEQEKAKAFGVVDVDDKDTITGFLEKPENPPCVPGNPGTTFASMGIYIFNKDFLVRELLEDAERTDSSHDFGNDIFPRIINEKRGNAIAHRFSGSCVVTGEDKPTYWRDVGTVDAFWEANMDLVNINPELDIYDYDWPIWTCHMQRPPAKFVFDIDGRRGEAIDSIISVGCIVSGSIVRRSILFTDARVNSYSLVEDTVMMPRTNVGRHCVLKKVIVSEGVRIPEGMHIGVDPEEDKKRFYVSEGGVVLVTKPMIDKLKGGSGSSGGSVGSSSKSSGSRSSAKGKGKGKGNNATKDEVSVSETIKSESSEAGNRLADKEKELEAAEFSASIILDPPKIFSPEEKAERAQESMVKITTPEPKIAVSPTASSSVVEDKHKKAI